MTCTSLVASRSANSGHRPQPGRARASRPSRRIAASSSGSAAGRRPAISGSMNGSRAPFRSSPVADDQHLLGRRPPASPGDRTRHLRLRRSSGSSASAAPIRPPDVAAIPPAGHAAARGRVTDPPRAGRRSAAPRGPRPSRGSPPGRWPRSGGGPGPSGSRKARYPPVAAATRIAAAAELTSVRFRFTQRRSFSRAGSGHADTGSSASQSSRSCASSRGESIPVLGTVRHRLQADRFERGRDLGVDLARPAELAAACVTEDRRDLRVRDRIPPGQQVVQGRPQAVDVAGEPDVAQVSPPPAPGS